MEAIESPYLLEREIPIYRVLTGDSESDFITKNFSDRKTVPSVCWIKDGEVLNKLPIVDKQNQAAGTRSCPHFGAERVSVRARLP